jgi:hypothetical protein
MDFYGLIHFRETLNFCIFPPALWEKVADTGATFRGGTISSPGMIALGTLSVFIFGYDIGHVLVQ